jgi:hypothetical protein
LVEVAESDAHVDQAVVEDLVGLSLSGPVALELLEQFDDLDGVGVRHHGLRFSSSASRLVFAGAGFHVRLELRVLDVRAYGLDPFYEGAVGEIVRLETNLFHLGEELPGGIHPVATDTHVDH